MADRQVDPLRLQGEALRRWYIRSPGELEQERQARYDQRYREFFARDDSTASTPSVAQDAPPQSRVVATQTSGSGGGLRNPLEMAQDALHGFQSGPKIQRPNTLESFIPVVGPAWEAAADLQDGNYGPGRRTGRQGRRDSPYHPTGRPRPGPSRIGETTMPSSRRCLRTFIGGCAGVGRASRG